MSSIDDQIAEFEDSQEDGSPVSEYVADDIIAYADIAGIGIADAIIDYTYVSITQLYMLDPVTTREMIELHLGYLAGAVEDAFLEEKFIEYREHFNNVHGIVTGNIFPN